MVVWHPVSLCLHNTYTFNPFSVFHTTTLLCLPSPFSKPLSFHITPSPYFIYDGNTKKVITPRKTMGE